MVKSTPNKPRVMATFVRNAFISVRVVSYLMEYACCFILFAVCRWDVFPFRLIIQTPLSFNHVYYSNNNENNDTDINQSWENVLH